MPLFDAYRQVYRFPSDRETANITSRLCFLTFDGGEQAGFMQPYPSFSSEAMARTLLLNDRKAAETEVPRKLKLALRRLVSIRIAIGHGGLPNLHLIAPK